MKNKNILFLVAIALGGFIHFSRQMHIGSCSMELDDKNREKNKRYKII